jgi:hypothetical protein
MRKATIASDTAAAAVTKPWIIGPSKMRITGVVTISKTRNRAAGNMLTVFLVYQARSGNCMDIAVHSSIACHNDASGIEHSRRLFVYYTIEKLARKAPALFG